MKKKFFLTLLIGIILFHGSANGQEVNIRDTIDKYLYGELKETVRDIIMNPEKITVFNVLEADNKTKEKKLIDLYWQFGKYKKRLNEQEKEQFCKILLHNPGSYQRGMILYSSDYYPTAAFKIESNQEYIVILISPSDKTWCIIYDDIHLFKNRYPSGCGIEEFIKMLLPSFPIK